MTTEEDNIKLLEKFYKIADEYYSTLLKIHYQEPYFTKAQNEELNQFLQNKIVGSIDKMGYTDEQVITTASKLVAVVTDKNR